LKLLLDTHTLIWAVDNPAKLGKTASTELQDPANELVLGTGTIWELAIKIGQGKLALSMPYRKWMERAIADLSLTIAPVTIEIVEHLIGLPMHHKDPFDRLLVCQALNDKLPVVSIDPILDSYGVSRIW